VAHIGVSLTAVLSLPLKKPTDSKGGTFMGLDSRKEKDGTILSITGRMDAVTTPEIEDRPTTLVSGGEKGLVIDLQGLEYSAARV
jgi:hypothetical protein